jgi:hypothetical protein
VGSFSATESSEPIERNRYPPRNRLHNNIRGFDRGIDPTDEQAGAWTEAFDAGTFVRKSSEFRDDIGADGTFDVASGQLSPFVV